eukprot:COSAG02_NODE_1166_length_14154_cov_19.442191_11_plen_152_part_00
MANSLLNDQLEAPIERSARTTRLPPLASPVYVSLVRASVPRLESRSPVVCTLRVTWAAFCSADLGRPKHWVAMLLWHDVAQHKQTIHKLATWQRWNIRVSCCSGCSSRVSCCALGAIASRDTVAETQLNYNRSCSIILFRAIWHIAPWCRT